MAKKDEPINEEPIVATELQEPAPEEPVKEESPEAPVETPQEEAPAEEEPKEETPEEQPEEEPKPPSRREQLRVQDLLKKYPNLASQEPVKTPNFREKVAADEDTYKVLEDTTRDFGQELASEVTARANYTTWHRFLQADDRVISQKYPELDKNSDKFYPAVADAVNSRYLQFVGYNPGDPARGIPPSVARPDVSYADYVEADMEYARELASMMAEDSRRNIAKQAASTGIRPDASTPKRLNLNKPPEQMTDEELKAIISQAGL